MAEKKNIKSIHYIIHKLVFKVVFLMCLFHKSLELWNPSRLKKNIHYIINKLVFKAVFLMCIFHKSSELWNPSKLGVTSSKMMLWVILQIKYTY